MPPHDDSPYRHDLGAAFARIAELERALSARDRPGTDPGTLRALAALRLAHLREDRELVIEQFRANRTRLFIATAVGMLGIFLGFARAAHMHPLRAAAMWMACGLAVIAVAGIGSALQSVLLSRGRSRLRAIDRRRAEEAILFGTHGHPVELTDRGPEPTGVRIAADPLVELQPDERELLLDTARRRNG